MPWSIQNHHSNWGRWRWQIIDDWKRHTGLNCVIVVISSRNVLPINNLLTCLEDSRKTLLPAASKKEEEPEPVLFLHYAPTKQTNESKIRRRSAGERRNPSVAAVHPWYPPPPSGAAAASPIQWAEFRYKKKICKIGYSFALDPVPPSSSPHHLNSIFDEERRRAMTTQPDDNSVDLLTLTWGAAHPNQPTWLVLLLRLLSTCVPCVPSFHIPATFVIQTVYLFSLSRAPQPIPPSIDSSSSSVF